MKIQEIKSDLIEIGLSDNLNLALLVYLAVAVRKTKHKVSVLVSGPSGLGKSTLAGAVLKLFPSEDIITVSRMTPAALVRQNDLREKILYVYERFQDRQFEQYIRQLLSEGEAICEILNRRIVLLGPTTLIETTVNSDLLGAENKSRCFVVGINKAIEARRNMLERQQLMRTREGWKLLKRVKEIQEKHKLFQKTLNADLVIELPYKIQFHARAYHALRTQDRILDVISAIAFIKQGDRQKSEVDGETFIEATKEDFYEARELLSCLSIDEDESILPRDTLEFIEILRKCEDELSSSFTRNRIHDALTKHGHYISYKMIAKHLSILAHVGFIEKSASRGLKNSIEYSFTKDFALLRMTDSANSCYATMSLL